MQLLDSRRLTGPNLQLRDPAAIAEIALDPGESVDAVIAGWDDAVTRMLALVGWSDATRFVRPFADGRGAAVGFAAPFDALYAATEVNEWAIEATSRVLAGRPIPDVDRSAARLVAMIAAERRPDLVALASAAACHGLPMLLDEDGVTIGLGAQSRTWSLADVPSPDLVAFDTLGTIPVVAVTGTNGKTTCARWLARIFANAGQTVGHTSTEGIFIGAQEIEPGDCTGPGAARRLLRRTELEAAVLETARGGLLRRGFVLPHCDAALITNVSDDHLGEFGIQTIDELASVKAIVAGCVQPDGLVVLGADSPPLAGRPWKFSAPHVWFALGPDHPTLKRHLQSGGEAWFVDDGAIVRARGTKRESIVAVADIALALGGTVVHNVENALGVAATATGLGLPAAAITGALREFGRDVADNPGRLERYELGGVAIVLDFAHNLDGLRHQVDVIAALRGERPGRLLVSFGMAGDRSDEMLGALALEIARMRPDRVILRDEPEYFRGRGPGEVPAILRAAFVRGGVDPAAIDEAPDERTAVTRARAWAKPGDMIAVFAHIERAPMW
jgi:cyanophycin synthetase